MAAAIAAVAIWGMVLVALRYFIAFLDPFAFSTIRFGTSALFALPLFVYARPWTWPVRDVARVTLCGFPALPGLNIPNVLAARFFGALGRITGDTAWKDRGKRTLAAVCTPHALDERGRWLGEVLLALDEVGAVSW